MGALAHFFEEEGVPTTQISLIRRHTEITRPPRALWVSFELGRPLGVANDPEFQKRVLVAALKLLEAPGGPVLEDYPEDAPSGDETIVLACPVSFVQSEADLTGAQKLCAEFRREMTSMRSWYDVAVGKRRRTTVGVSGLDLDAIPGFLCSFLDGGTPDNPRQDISLAYALKFAVDDLKAYYFEGVTAQPGQELASSRVLSDWFWAETAAARVLLAVKEACLASGDVMLQVAGGSLLIPMSAADAGAK